MQSDFADLLPLFVDESRDRLERVAGLLPRLEAEPRAVQEARRELHTMKGSARMLRLGTFAELCHATEEALQEVRPGRGAVGAPGSTAASAARSPRLLLTRAADRLAVMLEALARGEEPVADPELLALLTGGEPAAAGAAGDAAPVVVPGLAPTGAPRGFGTGAVAAPALAPAAAELRVEAVAVDSLTERAASQRLLALGAHRFVVRIDELARLADAGLREPEPRQVLAVLAAMLRRLAVEAEGAQRRLTRAAEDQLELILRVQLQPLRGAMLSLARYARDLARALGREVDVELGGEETRLDRRIVREIEEALLHLVRNAVDHGIEPPEMRAVRGKPRAGKIRLSASGEGGRVRLVIADDGAGIDAGRVLERAVESGLLAPAAAAAMAPEDSYRLLFEAGFSTRRDVSEISGRGIGLDVVAAVVGRLGGEVSLDSEPGEGTEITLELPVTRRGEHVMLLRVGRLRLALPAAAVRRAMRLPRAQVEERDGRFLALVGERLVPCVPLADLYGQPPGERPLLLEGTAAGAALAVLVDDVEGEEEVLVRPLGRAVETDRLFEGMALLASGEPVGVLSPAMLARPEATWARPAARQQVVATRSRILLVDDSPVTRAMERRLLEDAGFEVVAAGDAAEALARLGEQVFDCLVVDIEMPGMDGFRLTEQLRAIEQFAQLPIVVVSTRDRLEDRLRGLKAGADAYLTKQTLDAGELVALVRRLVGR